ncbi:alanine racemase [Spongisporangium articulatum]|uniref:Alanine racemase n=1 Tax=Spongisporangium articulatum TaxID=3362603 RepID=A0ABW8ANG0_9ACTN
MNRIDELAAQLAAVGDLPAFVTDLQALGEQGAAIRAALGPDVEWYYAAKANPDPRVLQVLTPYVDGVEVASLGELRHVRAHLPRVPLALAGPVKPEPVLAAALAAGVELVHVESVRELTTLAAVAEDRVVDVLLRANPALAVAEGAALVMGGRPSPFGLDPAALDACAALLPQLPGVRFRGLHTHLASGLTAAQHLELAAGVLEWATAWSARHGLPLEVVNLGGGMAVDYRADRREPGARFDWAAEGAGLQALSAAYPGVRLRLEPGRAVSAYCGHYLARVVDVRASHGEWFAVVDGGTHHLRTPAARGHSQPLRVVPLGENRSHVAPLTVSGALCTPRDVLAHLPEGATVGPGDVVVFEMAGAYGWNISHHDFLMHPHPSFHHVG